MALNNHNRNYVRYVLAKLSNDTFLKTPKVKQKHIIQNIVSWLIYLERIFMTLIIKSNTAQDTAYLSLKVILTPV